MTQTHQERGIEDQGSIEDSDGGIDLITLLWRARRAVLVAVVVCGLFYAGLAALVWSWGPVRSTVSQEIIFTFDGASKRQYPNGASFSPQDLLAEPVLNMVYEQLHLAGVLKPADLAAGLSIRDGGGVELMLLQSDFSQKLQNTKLTQPERDKLEKDYRVALSAAKDSVFEIGRAHV